MSKLFMSISEDTKSGIISKLGTTIRSIEVYNFFEAEGLSSSQARAFINNGEPTDRKGYRNYSNIVPISAANTSKSDAYVDIPEETIQKAVSSVISEFDPYIPEVDDTYVRWGYHKDLNTIVNSKLFYPVYLSGDSGNGKTIMIEQVCAKLKREYVRIQITPETDEDDLLGGWALVDNATVFREGPVIKAMRAGSILLIDEIDRGSNRIMALQGVLEGKPVLLKKTGETIKPAKGFNIIATGNTQGRGSDDGRYSAATIIDDAFLERFVIAINQDHPSKSVETKILVSNLQLYKSEISENDSKFINFLTVWANIIRKTQKDGGIDESISTRRLTHIIKTYSIFDNSTKSVELCTNRYEEDTKLAFNDLWEKVVGGELTDTDEESLDINN